MYFELLTAYGWQGIALLVWLGLSVGSFLNVVIYRLPVMLEADWKIQATQILSPQIPETELAPNSAEGSDSSEPPESTPAFNLMVPRSRCPSCGHQITALENIPVFSWLFLGRKCSDCKTPISARYPGIEILTAALTIISVAVFGFTITGFSVCLATWMLIALTFIDYDTTLLPDQITLPLLWIGLLINLSPHSGFVPLGDAVIGAVAGYLFLWGTYWAFKLATGKEGMGYGDFKLFAALGAWLGWQVLPAIILVSASLGLIYALVNILMRKSTTAEPIPFGPFLSTAGWMGLINRDPLIAFFSF